MDLKLSCNCKKVTGVIHDVKPGTGNRVVCYCADCRAFARALERDGDTLDPYGGTDIFQVAPSRIEISGGKEYISCLRLTEKGLYRWYTSCCNTPLGNTGKPGMPLVGLIHTFMSPNQDIESIIGPIEGQVFARKASKKLPVEMKGPKSEFRVVMKMLGKLAAWKLTGKSLPNPFFDSSGKPLAEPRKLGQGTSD